MKNINYKLNYSTNSDSLILKFELPGKAKEDVKVSVTENGVRLTVNDLIYVAHFKDHTSYMENFRSPLQQTSFWEEKPLDIRSAKATMKNGLLTLEIPFEKEKENHLTIE